MSYVTCATGEFRITPPLTWREMKDSPFLPNGTSSRDLVLRVDEETVDGDDGVLIRRTASALVMREIDEYRAYDLLDHVQQAVAAFPGHEWSGRLECEGEDNSDMWRVVIRNGRAVKVQPRIIWPDEDGVA